MDCILVVHDETLPSGHGRATVALRHIEMALGARGRVERCDVATAVGLRGSSRSFEKVRTSRTIVAFGYAAHLGLADFEKRSVFSNAFGLESADDPERMVWSCINTLQALALGDATWRSVQVLPIGTICARKMPPLAAVNPHCKARKRSVRIICHDRETLHTEIATTRLREAGFEVIQTSDWLDDAAIHVHVGGHGHETDTLRLIDSLASGRLVIQVPSQSASSPADDDFRVEHEMNGIVCRSASAIPAACEEVCADPTFFDKLVSAGQATVEPLSKGWRDVAHAILA